eukprot:TRINITY_DN36032_c0_g1_i1.p1 TRINITY_DN36032_c0_g1~~TRINITY_DN36032_c0_g1_i1.p1  ORF type:complete len:1435 (-),score=279.90 TRINITY_DN36032_c0_g1_i1:50-4354(-)
MYYFHLGLLSFVCLVRGDVYMHNPRGSNNKLSEQSNNAQNQQRLFDSQNNAAGGYQIGDNCKPVCQDENRNYDETKGGAMQGHMTYYKGSDLYIEWTAQHGCGVGQTNVICQMVLQYMCESDNPGIRDGTKRGNDNTAGGDSEPPVLTEAAETSLGQHEPIDFYLDCKKRDRQKGLYTADQNVRNDRGATATRQNPGGNGNQNDRNGLECPEERDYYPYWHPTPWHDIAILTDEPQQRCAYYRNESQNVRAKGYCSPEPETENVPNNPEDCAAASLEWKEKAAHGEPPPECVGGMASRDNHLGNARGGRPLYYLWRIPDTLDGRCVLRLRYNITTADFRHLAVANQDGPATEARDVGNDYFFIDSSQNDPNPGQRRRNPFKGGPPLLTQDPVADWLDLGDDFQLQLQVNTNQYGRTFQDRSHSFYVRDRPVDVPPGARVVNYNVRGRRGNIVQTYPSVEYDFVPQHLTVEQGDYLHIQWTGSDANAKGNAGNGRQGTDRSNLVQVSDIGENVPLPLSQHTLFFDAKAEADNSEGKEMARKLAYLDQQGIAACDKEDNDQNSVNNCKQLNGASAYFDAGLVQMKQLGTHKVISTRNNDFSNRSQKSSITVIMRLLRIGEIVGVIAGVVAFLACLAYIGAAVYAFYTPSSWLFSKRYRPCILRFICRKASLERQLQIRKEWKKVERQRWKEIAEPRVSDASGKLAPEASKAGADDAKGLTDSFTKPPSNTVRCLRCLRFLGLGEGQRITLLFILVLNAIAFLSGFSIHVGYGFHGSIAYPFAKGAGFALDMDLALLLLPTLKSLQTALRGKTGAVREWVPLDDPIAFHITLAKLIAVNSLIHIVAHCFHMQVITVSPPIAPDPLEAWRYTTEELLAGTSIGELLSGRSQLTGILVTLLMMVIYTTALPSVRRATCCLARRCGGFRLFQRAHALWPLVYLLLLIHTSSRFWVWMFFPFLFVLVDRLMLLQRRRFPAVLKSARLLLFDVIHLTFEIPENFTYQAGQYVMLNWKGEWHPFTLTSAPEERQLTLHIRAASNMDWCSALRRELTKDAPNAAAGEAATKDPSPGTVIEYDKLFLPNGTICCKARAGSSSLSKSGTASAEAVSLDVFTSAEDDGPPTLTRTHSAESESLVGSIQQLPAGVVQLQLQGPFGAPAQRVWEFKTVMVVGAGIGVTPFVSILRSVQMRKQQQMMVLRSASGRSGWADSEAARPARRKVLSDGLHGMAPPAGKNGRTSSPSRGPKRKAENSKKPVAPSLVGAPSQMDSRHLPGVPASTPSTPLASTIEEAQSTAAVPLTKQDDMVDQIIDDVIPVPQRIHFYWIVRNQQELDWFHDLLAAGMEGPAKKIVEVNLFVTGEVELSAVKELAFVHHQYFGRPNWGRIFKGCRAEHKGEHVGVFLCGSPVIGDELARQSNKNSDPVDFGPGRTRFSFFKEHF